ncbi:MAG: hypothetical protein R3C52_01145 [Hyphomonadaceae bacterium]
MSFGKRGQTSPFPPATGAAAPIEGATPDMPDVGVSPGGSVRSAALAVTSPGSDSAFSAGFMALVAGVFIGVIALGLAGPSLLTSLGSLGGEVKLRAVPVIVEGLDRGDAKTALATQAFPDRQGAAFMKRLKTDFPKEHDRLTGQLADIALSGGERTELIEAVNLWSADFSMRHIGDLGRTGAKGFNAMTGIASDAIDLLEKAGGGACDAGALQSLAQDPARIAELGTYGTPAYKLNMKANLTLVSLAADGARTAPVDASLTPQDERALQRLMVSMMQDRRVQKIQVAALSNGSAPDIDVCDLGRVVIDKLDSLPSGTKGRLLALGAEQVQPLMQSAMFQLN